MCNVSFKAMTPFVILTFIGRYAREPDLNGGLNLLNLEAREGRAVVGPGPQRQILRLLSPPVGANTQ